MMISNAARDYLLKQMTTSGDVALRLSIKKTGCSGYAYVPTLIREINSLDILTEVEGIKVCIDAKWSVFLSQVEIDYITENQGGLLQKRLVIKNNSENGRCGCGESFNLTE